jgi:hypothetical protein
MLPPSWDRGYLDWKYIKGVQKEFGTKSLRSYPHLSVLEFLYLNIFKGIRSISFINYVDFNKSEAMEIIQRELGWQYYGGKHYESIYTRFYQSYILPTKFNIDKRKAHLSCLIMSTGEVTREDAIMALMEPAAQPKMIEDDKEYVIKKLGITSSEFNNLMLLPLKTIFDYANIHTWEMRFRKVLNKLREMKILPN